MKSFREAAFHRTIWRWHFWAGLIVAPFLLILSLTGAIYLFDDELNDAIYPELRFVQPHATSVPVSTMIRAALAAHPGAVTRVDLPDTTDRAAVVFVTPDSGDPRRVHIDPGTGRVLGSLVHARTLVGWADQMHGSLTIGTIGDRIVELAACWTLVLMATGLFLWWPRGRWQAAGVFWPRWSGKGRRFWRDLHGPVGVWTMALIAFLILTGLPWAGIQGDVLQRATRAAGIGYPASFRNYTPPQSATMKATLGEAPWTLEAAPMPSSHAGHGVEVAGDTAAIGGVDRVTALLASRGFPRGYRLFLPGTPTGVYTAFTYPDQPEGQRTIYVDRYSYRQIGPEVGFADYGWAGRAIELGVQLHMGNYFGRANQLLMLLPCIAIWVLTISGVAMWWKRRPAGRIGAPPRLEGARTWPLALMLVIMGIAMPLLGGSLLVVATLDRLIARRHRFSAAPP